MENWFLDFINSIMNENKENLVAYMCFKCNQPIRNRLIRFCNCGAASAKKVLYAVQ